MKPFRTFFLLFTFLLFLNSTRVAAISSVSAGIKDSITTYCVIPNNAQIHIMSNYTGSLGAGDTLNYQVDFGDGTDTMLSIVSGIIGYQVIEHTYYVPGTFTTRHIIYTNSGFRDTAYGTGFTLFNSCGSISGNLFVDSNSNCLKDSAESDIYLSPIVAINTTTLDTITAGWTDHLGHYNIPLSPGNYNIIPNYYYASPGLASANPCINPSCPSSGSYSLSVAAAGSYTKDFAYTCGTPVNYDARALVSGGCFVPGDTSVVYIWGGTMDWYYHYSCIMAGLSSTITVTLDPKITYIGHYYGASPTILGSTLTYNLSTISALSAFYAGFYVKTATTATIGDTILISANMAPISGISDPNSSNNTHNYKKAVASSFDPNVKEVTPQGYGTVGFIKANEEMSYTIHFQNTGTAAAKTVTIVDEIDADLDINSIRLLGSTHNANLTRSGSKIKFIFEHINLLDSGTNYAASMGAITYSIKQKRDLAPGSKIENTAAIFFDYNSPIITNTTLNTIMIPTSIENATLGNDVVTIYPNPAQNTLNVKMDNTKAFSVNMMDMLGRIVMTQSAVNGELSINTTSVPSGLYIVNINDNNGNQTSRKVQIKH